MMTAGDETCAVNGGMFSPNSNGIISPPRPDWGTGNPTEKGYNEIVLQFFPRI